MKKYKSPIVTSQRAHMDNIAESEAGTEVSSKGVEILLPWKR